MAPIGQEDIGLVKVVYDIAFQGEFAANGKSRASRNDFFEAAGCKEAKTDGFRIKALHPAQRIGVYTVGRRVIGRLVRQRCGI